MLAQNRLSPILWCVCTLLIAASARGPIILSHDGRDRALAVHSLGGREYLSLAAVAEATGGRFTQDTRRQRSVVTWGSSSVTLQEGTPRVRVGPRSLLLSAPPRRRGSTLLVPIDFLPLALETAFGKGRVIWDPERRVARVETQSFTLHRLRYWSYGEHTRIVLDATRPHDVVLRDEGAGQIVLEIPGGIFSPSLARQTLTDPLVISLTPVQEKEGARLFVQKAAEGRATRAFALKDPPRLVVDVFRSEAVPPDGVAPSSRENLVPSPAAPPRERTMTVVIDPGHGGRDAGAMGPRGLMEKDITLDIGLRLRKLLQGQRTLRVVMTRTEDVFIPLEERTALANRSKADFFISIHVNAAPRSKAMGFETYYFTKEPSDSQARASAIQENLALNFEGTTPRDPEGYLKVTLGDLLNDAFRKGSSELAEILLNELDTILAVENRGVKSGPFYVLAGAAMPSVLVEVAFISNLQEERKLQSEAYRQRLAEALAAGVTKFAPWYEKRLGMIPSPPLGSRGPM